MLLKSREAPGPVVARELGGRGETETVALARPAHEPLLVHARDGRRQAVRPDRERRGIALGGIDPRGARRSCARPAERADAERQDVGVGGERAVGRSTAPVTRSAPRARSAATRVPSRTVTPSFSRQIRARLFGEQAGIAARVADVADGAGDLLPAPARTRARAARPGRGPGPPGAVRARPAAPSSGCPPPARAGRGRDRARRGSRRGTRCPRLRTRSAMTAWLYWQRRSLTIVFRRARARGALAKEPEAPGEERGVEPRAHADRGLRSEERAKQHRGRLGRRPRERVARRDDAGVGRARVPPDARPAPRRA